MGADSDIPASRVVALMAERSERATRLRQSSPFAGVLSEEERPPDLPIGRSTYGSIRKASDLNRLLSRWKIERFQNTLSVMVGLEPGRPRDAALPAAAAQRPIRRLARPKY
jgi:hypothetical protein